MKAALFKKYGSSDSILVSEVELPKIKEHEILIRVKATTVTAVDAIFRSGNDLFPRMATGLFSPRIKTLGTELSGVVEALGEKVNDFKIGDEVIADSGTNYGAHAEYVIVSDKDPIVHKPEGLSFEEAAAVPYGALTALPFLRDHGKIKQGDRVLIIGASGSVGTYAVQLAKYFETEVTAVCSSEKVEPVSSLGADHCINYQTTKLEDIEDQFDIIFDTIGKYSMRVLKHLLCPQGIYLTTVLSLGSVIDMLMTKGTDKKSILALTGLRKNEDKTADLLFISELFNQKKLISVIDRKFDLEAIHDAFEYVSKGHKSGAVVVTT